MSHPEGKKKDTDDLSKTEYGKTWSISDDSSISYALSDILQAALAERPETGTGMLFYIPNESNPLVITGEDVIQIGRAGGNANPTVDLNPYHGRELGVSRIHAEIIFRDGSYVIKDLGSTNGTWVNDTRLDAHAETALQDSDQLRLGHFTMLIKFSE